MPSFDFTLCYQTFPMLRMPWEAFYIYFTIISRICATMRHDAMIICFDYFRVFSTSLPIIAFLIYLKRYLISHRIPLAYILFPSYKPSASPRITLTCVLFFDPYIYTSSLTIKTGD